MQAKLRPARLPARLESSRGRSAHVVCGSLAGSVLLRVLSRTWSRGSSGDGSPPAAVRVRRALVAVGGGRDGPPVHAIGRLFQLSYSPTGCGVYQRPPLGPGCATERLMVAAPSSTAPPLLFLLRGVLVVDGGGGPGALPDVGVWPTGTSPSVTCRTSTRLPVGTRWSTAHGPEFVALVFSPVRHSEWSLFVDGAPRPAICTKPTRPSCPATAATPNSFPSATTGRELVELALRPNGLVARWRTFAEYLDGVEEVQEWGRTWHSLFGHNTVRGSVLGRRETDRPPTAELSAILGEGVGGPRHGGRQFGCRGRGGRPLRHLPTARCGLQRDPYTCARAMVLLASLGCHQSPAGRPAAGLLAASAASRTLTQVRRAVGSAAPPCPRSPASRLPAGGSRRGGRPVPSTDLAIFHLLASTGVRGLVDCMSAISSARTI